VSRGKLLAVSSRFYAEPSIGDYLIIVPTVTDLPDGGGFKPPLCLPASWALRVAGRIL